MTVHVREATDVDVPAIQFLRRAWLEEDVGGPVDDPEYETAFSRWWDRERGHRRHWVAEVDGEVVAMVSVVTISRMPQPGRRPSEWGYVHHMVVRPDRRHEGVGTALLSAAMEGCRAAGFEQLLLHPRERSRPFYERLGFVAVGDAFLRCRL